MSRINNANAQVSNVVAMVRDYAVVAGIVARRLCLHLTTTLGKGATSKRGFHQPSSMSPCLPEVCGMWFHQLALIPVTKSPSKPPLSSKRWS